MTIFTEKAPTKPNQQQITSNTSQIALKSLAVIGFIALIIAGILLAIYTARFMPSITGAFESGTAYMSGILLPQPQKNKLTVIPQTTVSSDNAVATSTKKLSTKTVNKPTIANNTNKPISWRAEKKITNQLYPTGGQTVATTTSYYGLPDLATTITAVGYLTGTSTDNFIASNTIPAHAQVAVKFRVINQGTNVTGRWSLEIHIPTELNSIYQSKMIQSLLPGQPEDFIVHFTNAIAGTNKKITVTVDPKNQIKESNKKNNSATVGITILGN